MTRKADLFKHRRKSRLDQIAVAEGKPLEGEIISPLRPQDALRSPAEQ